ncbi:MAG: sensor histidine kinase [Cellulosilyticaceae bacterium]
MKPIKSFISLLGLILIYAYMLFLFKAFRVEDSFSFFHWIVLLVCHICVVLISYYPIHVKQMRICSYLTFFTSLSYIGFLLSAIFSTVQGLHTFRYEKEMIYLMSLCSLLMILLIAFLAIIIIFRYPAYRKHVIGGFFGIVVLQHMLLLYINLSMSTGQSYPLYLSYKAHKKILLLILCSLHTLILPLFYHYLKTTADKMKLQLPQTLTLMLGIYGLSFIFFVDVLWGNPNIFGTFVQTALSLLLIYSTITNNLHILKIYINEQLLPYKENVSLMNHYYTHLSTAQSQLDRRYHHMDSVYKQILSCYPDAYFVLLDFNICDTNEFGMKLIGCEKKDSVIGEDFLTYVAAKDHAKLRKLMQKLPLTNIPVNSDFEMRSPTGAQIYVEGSFIVADLYDHPSILVSVRDLSFHKETYNLQRQIEMEKLKVEFFSTISHELKTPVNIIYSAAQLQETLIKNQQFGELDTYSQMITHNCLRLLRLLNNLLDISRLESNYFCVKASPLNIVPLSESLLGSIVPYANRRQISCVFDTDSEEIYCNLDPDLLERILLNLLSNAVKYGKENGMIEMTLQCSHDMAHIHIKDNGVGIPKEKLDYIFDRFMRVENGLIRSAEGSGIGLSLVKSLVEKQHGLIQVESKLDRGSEFIVSFPLVDVPEGILEDSSPEITSTKIELEFSDVFHTG